MIITVETVLATDPYSDYTPERIRELVGDGLDPAHPATLEVVLSLPPEDARRVLSRLLTLPDVVVWAQACADRAGMYATAAQYSDESYDAADAADAYAASARYAAAAYVAHYDAVAAHYDARSALSAAAAAYYDRDAGYYDARSAAYYAAARSARSARSAAAAAYYDAAAVYYHAEHRLACQHALALLASS